MGGRQEYKYVVPLAMLPLLRQSISPYVIPDNHNALRRSNSYEVRSIYFDTFGLNDYQEKLAGLQERKKIRIRGYNQQLPDSEVFLEIKRKYNMFISKDRAPIQYIDVPSFLRKGKLDQFFPQRRDFPKSRKNASKFLFHLNRKSLTPVNLVTYTREAYIGKFNHSDRVTFDMNIRSKMFPRMENLFTDDGLLTFLRQDLILEFKSENVIPKWFHRIIMLYSLRRQAYSKYIEGVNAHYSDNNECTVNNVIANSHY